MNVIVRNKRTNNYYEKSIKVKELWYKAPSDELLEDYEKLKRRHFNRAMTLARSKLRASEIKQRNKLSAMGVNADGEIASPTAPTIQSNPTPVITAESQANTQSAINSILNS
jgi:hypothetical protein